MATGENIRKSGELLTPEGVQRQVAAHLERRAHIEELAQLRSPEVAKLIRKALRERSGKAWSVTIGRGTAYGWITIDISDRTRTMTEAERAELAQLLGVESVHHQGESIPSSMAYRRVWLARCLYGDDLGFTAEPYWD